MRFVVAGLVKGASKGEGRVMTSTSRICQICYPGFTLDAPLTSPGHNPIYRRTGYFFLL